MRVRDPTHTSGIGLLILVFLYIILIILILLFSQQIISNISKARDYTETFQLILIASLGLPVILLGIIFYNIFKLIRERILKKAGSKLKTRLILFFIFIVLLSLTPQAFLSIGFINSAINFWFGTNIGEAMEGGWELYSAFYLNKVDNLMSFSNSSLLSNFLVNVDTSPEKTWELIKEANPEINLFQVFNSKGEELFFSGKPEGRITDFNNINIMQYKESTPDPVKDVRGILTILRRLVIFQYENEEYYVFLGITFSKKLEEYGSMITEIRRIFKQVFQFKGLFSIAIIIFYFLFSFPIFLLAILVSFLLTEEIIRPTVDLEEATKRVAEGDFSFRILTRTHDELSLLVSSFNKMVSELGQSRKKLIKAEKISAWKEIAQRLAHEIKNPLTPIKLSAQRMLKKYKDNSKDFENVMNQGISAIINEVDNLNKLLLEFREFAKLPDPYFENADLSKIIDEAISIYENLSQKITFQKHLHSDIILIKVDRNQMKQVFANLFKNAIQAIPDTGTITVVTDVIQKETRHFLRIQVQDTGTGMEKEILDQIFDPYFTTKKQGSGLGLAIVERIIFDHNGIIWFETEIGSGTTFFIDLPYEEQ